MHRPVPKRGGEQTGVLAGGGGANQKAARNRVPCRPHILIRGESCPILTSIELPLSNTGDQSALTERAGSTPLSHLPPPVCPTLKATNYQPADLRHVCNSLRHVPTSSHPCEPSSRLYFVMSVPAFVTSVPAFVTSLLRHVRASLRHVSTSLRHVSTSSRLYKPSSRLYQPSSRPYQLRHVSTSLRLY